jgi:hypothetical protein
VLEAYAKSPERLESVFTGVGMILRLNRFESTARLAEDQTASC